MSVKLFERQLTHQQALDLLELARWAGSPTCPYCSSSSIGRHVSKDRAQQRWQCRECSRAFSATVGTIFHRTHTPLRRWFYVISVVIESESRTSAKKLAGDLGMRRATVAKMLRLIRCALSESPENIELFKRIILHARNNGAGNE